jgi:hypothetical protein
MQNIPNPVPRVVHPDWLHKQVSAAKDRHKQQRLTNMFKPTKRMHAASGEREPLQSKEGGDSDVDMEDMDILANTSAAAARQSKRRRKLATLYRVRLHFLVL